MSARAGRQPIVRKKLGEQVFEQLGAQIESGALKPGDHLPPERELMQQFGVGRPAIREALQLLQGKGLVVVSHGERSRVARLSAATIVDQVDDVARLLLSQQPDSLADLKQLRRLIEIGTVELAAARCVPADVRALRQLIEDQRQQLGRPRPFMEGDIAFHARIAEVSGNGLLQVVSATMLSWIFDYHTSLLHWSGKEERTLQEHERIVACLARNDVAGAATMMTAHLDRSEPLTRSRPTAAATVSD